LSVLAFDHYNLSAHRADLERLRAFYVDVVGLHDGARPPIERFGYWLYAGGSPVLHLIEARPGEQRDADVSGTFNHVAFRCSGYDGALAALRAQGVAVRVVEDPVLRSRQLFFRDPLGNGVELAFAAGKDPQAQ
jgi:catechol 2,3-dioxygenase-like lactoylglutathione lyase family enzyme